MASTIACPVSTAVLSPCRAPLSSKKSIRPSTVSFGNFSGLRANQSMPVLSQKKSVDEEFAQVSASYRKSSRGGAMTSECSLASEIFGVVPIISALVLTGVALGFVLLRVEAAVEESEE